MRLSSIPKFTITLLLTLSFTSVFQMVFCAIYVRSPRELVNKFPNNGEIIGSISKFGNIPYGYNVVGSLYYDPLALKKDVPSLGCRDSYTFGLKLNSTADIDESPIIMMDRGDCSFVHKVAKAEIFGAHAVIIANNNNEDINNLVMADNGNGKFVTIPAELISKKDADILKEYIKNNPEKEVSIELDFEIEAKEQVTVSFYMISNMFKVYSIMNDFEKYFNELVEEKAINIQPHYVSNPHPLYELGVNSKGNSDLYEDCYGGGKYCITGFSINSMENVFGYDLNKLNNPITIIEENLMQKCIYKYAEEKKKPEIYYQYMTSFYENCIKKDNFTKECGKTNLLTSRELKTEIHKMNECVYGSFKFTNPSDTVESDKERRQVKNTILENDNDIRNTYYVKYIPSILINGKVFWGNWTPENLLEVICSSLIKKPKICFSYGGLSGEKASSSSLTTYAILIIAFCFVITLGIFMYCRYKIQQNIHNNLDSSNFGHKINTVVTSYLSLKDTKKGDTSMSTLA